jgi:hypothetical protein
MELRAIEPTRTGASPTGGRGMKPGGGRGGAGIRMPGGGGNPPAGGCGGKLGAISSSASTQGRELVAVTAVLSCGPALQPAIQTSTRAGGARQHACWVSASKVSRGRGEPTGWLELHLQGVDLAVRVPVRKVAPLILAAHDVVGHLE